MQENTPGKRSGCPLGCLWWKKEVLEVFFGVFFVLSFDIFLALFSRAFFRAFFFFGCTGLEKISHIKLRNQKAGSQTRTVRGWKKKTHCLEDIDGHGWAGGK